MNRRRLLIALSLLPLGPGLAAGTATADSQVFVDSAGRKVALPKKIDRVLAAGPPASVLLYALAPDKMVGWVRAFSTEEKAFIAEPYRDLPVHGRLTGKGNVMSPDEVKALKPGFILDIGTVDPTYAALADRVQADTGVPSSTTPSPTRRRHFANSACCSAKRIAPSDKPDTLKPGSPSFRRL